MELDQNSIDKLMKEDGSKEAPAKAAAAAATTVPTADPSTVTKILQAQDEKGRGDVSAATIGRMLGLATSGELVMLESKMDLLATKISAVTARVERMVSILSAAPTGKDLERIDVQIAAMRQMLREGLDALKIETSESGEAGADKK
ncbi:MAG: hypothetical protein K1X79_14485 [Oligoflexia bacterium]|nr:hypothetical protein [Oligoflexia bacterium]